MTPFTSRFGSGVPFVPGESGSTAGFDRRTFGRISLASALGVSLSGWLPQLARAESRDRRKACILLWMAGGPSQTDTFDLKPGHENGGPYKEIATTVPGIRISEHLPGVAKQMKDLAIIRSMTSREGDHGLATGLMLTGYRTQAGGIDYPVLGSLVAKELEAPSDVLPPYVCISPVRANEALGAGFLGPKYAPMMVTGASDDPSARANLSIENLAPPAAVSNDSLKRRFEVLSFMQKQFGDRADGRPAAVHRANAAKAMRLIESQAKQAFQLEEEPAALRDAYGRSRFGQGCLLARRLVERGASFVEVALTGVNQNQFGWDTHAENFDQVKALSAVLDPAWSTLMTDLRERGMLDDVLVVWMGEFGRTPKINGTRGRDHFPVAWSTVLGGGGIRGGQVVGNTGPDGMTVVDRPVQPPDFLATICMALGIDHKKENLSTIGRPISMVEAGGEPVRELIAAKPT